MDSYYKLRQLIYYKLRHRLLRIATGVTTYDGVITKIATIQTWLGKKYRIYSIKRPTSNKRQSFREEK